MYAYIYGMQILMELTGTDCDLHHPSEFVFFIFFCNAGFKLLFVTVDLASGVSRCYKKKKKMFLIFQALRTDADFFVLAWCSTE